MTRLTKEAYRNLIKEDIEWLCKYTIRSLERDHIIDVLMASIEHEYSEEGIKRYYNNDFKEARDDESKLK